MAWGKKTKAQSHKALPGCALLLCNRQLHVSGTSPQRPLERLTVLNRRAPAIEHNPVFFFTALPVADNRRIEVSTREVGAGGIAP